MSESDGGAVPGAQAAATETAPTDNAEMQVAEAESGERQYSEEEAPDFKMWKHKLNTRNDKGDADEVDYDELVKGYMRQKDYTQKSQTNATSRKEYEQTKTHLGTILKTLRNPTMAGLQQLHDWGFPIMDQFNDLQTNADRHNALSAEEQHQENMRRQQEAFDRKNQVRDAREEQAKQAQMRQEYAAPMKRMTTAALEAVDLPRDNQHAAMVMQELKGTVPQHRQITGEDIKHAAATIRKRADAYMQRMGLVKEEAKEPPPSPRRTESYKQKSPEARAAGNKKNYSSFQDKMQKIARGY